MSPCGFAVDLMRTAYATDVKFWRDSDDTVRIRWYRVSPDRPWLPYGTLFSSYNWDSESPPIMGEAKGTLFQGEQLDADRPWSNGREPVPTQFNGHVCGTAEQWGGDLLRERDLPLPMDVNGNPACCTGLPPIPERVVIRTAGVVFFGPGVADHTASFPNFFLLNRLLGWPVIYRAVHGNVHYVIDPLHQVTLPVAWTLAFDQAAGTVVVTGSHGAGGGIPAKEWTYSGVRSETTVPLPLGPDWQSEFNNSTVEIPGYAPAEEADMLIGSVVWDAGTDAVPPRYLVCDGSAVSRDVYSLLFGRIGTSYGPGDGSTTFNLPDLRDLCPVGSGRLYGTAATGGEATHTLTTAELAAHAHTYSDPGHSHSPGEPGNNFLTGLGIELSASDGVANVGIDVGQNPVLILGTSTDTCDISIDNAGAGDPHNNMQPFMALRPLIYAGV